MIKLVLKTPMVSALGTTSRYHTLLSMFAFNFDLCRYITEVSSDEARAGDLQRAVAAGELIFLSP